MADGALTQRDMIALLDVLDLAEGQETVWGESAIAPGNRWTVLDRLTLGQGRQVMRTRRAQVASTG